MIENQIFFRSDKNQITIPYSKCNFERKNEKYELDLYLLKAYLRFNCTVSGKVCTTLNAITSGCGYSIKGNSKRANDKFRELLLYLQGNRDIYCDKELETIKNSEYFELQLASNDIFYCEKNFVNLTMEEYDRLIAAETPTGKNILLATYLCIKKNIYYNADVPTPKLSIPSNDAIKNVLGVASVKTVKSAISDLQQLNMIYSNEVTYYYKDAKSDMYLPTRNVYALDRGELKRTKEALAEFYQVNYIYTASEIDTGKIVYLKNKT